MNIKTMYEKAELEVICFDSEDVSTTSLGDVTSEGGYEEEFEEE